MATKLNNNKKTRSPKIYTAKTIDTRSHSFNVGIATDYSPNIALWIGHLGFWTEKNLANNKHIHDGLVWCYDTLEAICEYFPYFTRRQIETIINNSVEEGLVKRGNYNHTEYDRTCWYALTPKAYVYFKHLLTEKNLRKLYASISQICEMDFSDLCNGFNISVTPIPDTDPDTDPDSVGKEDNGVSRSHTNIKKLKKEKSEEKAITNEKVQEVFKEKFAEYDVTLEQIFDACKEHYEQKSLWATTDRFLKWLLSENIKFYKKKKPQLDEKDLRAEQMKRYAEEKRLQDQRIFGK